MGLRKTILLLLLVTLSLGAGVEIGWMWTPLQKLNAGAPSTQPSSGPRPWFDQLGLSPDQQTQMDKIWGDTRQQMQKLFQQRRDLQRQREQQVLALLNTAQRAAYDKINQGTHEAWGEIDKQRDALISDANARSRALLDPSQQEKWDILSKEMRGRHGQMGNATQRSTTMPSFVGTITFEGGSHHD